MGLKTRCRALKNGSQFRGILLLLLVLAPAPPLRLLPPLLLRLLLVRPAFTYPEVWTHFQVCIHVQAILYVRINSCNLTSCNRTQRDICNVLNVLYGKTWVTYVCMPCM